LPGGLAFKAVIVFKFQFLPGIIGKSVIELIPLDVEMDLRVAAMAIERVSLRAEGGRLHICAIFNQVSRLSFQFFVKRLLGRGVRRHSGVFVLGSLSNLN